ncbi:MAG TPA: hypothetical protein QKA08_01830 [Candidatus Megaira endosymbiont of Nemacystus decipiens]|nr:hypothetical protein [Candidatus Megaera endosymbiont of Nemacystus decipiens]
MNQTELYSLIFTDTFVANLAFCFTNEIAVGTIKVFNNYNLVLVILLASFASILAYAVNYIFGKVVFKILKPFQQEKGQSNTIKFQKLDCNIFFRLLLFLSAFSIYGKFIVFFIGFANLSFRQMIFITSVAKLTYYFYFLIL